jgi:hypothetical protein
MPSRNPFLYPQERHRRTLSPGPYQRYRSYKPHLRIEFGAQCVYCRLPDALPGRSAFGVDHYRPRRYFPDYSVIYSNLFYSCNACNSAKGDYWPVGDQGKRDVFVPNPCDYVMTAHLRYKGPRVEGRTVAGRFTIDLLRINEDASVDYRRLYQEIIDALYSNVATERERVTLLERRIAGASGPQRTELDRDKRRRQQRIERLEQRIDLLLSRSL